MPMKSFNINEDEPILGNHKWEQASRKVAHRRCKDKKNKNPCNSMGCTVLF